MKLKLGMHTLVYFLAVSAPLMPSDVFSDEGINHDTEIRIGDFDGDGNRDALYLTKQSGRNRLAFARGGRFVCVENRIPTDRIRRFDTTICGDFDGDGKTDIFFLRYATGQNCFAFSRANETFAIVDDRIPRASINGYDQALAGDFDGDHRVDLFFIRHQTGANRIAFARGNEEFTVVNARIPEASMNGYTDAVTGDFNGDGRTDIFVINRLSGNNRVAYAAENETFSLLTDRVIPGHANGWKYLLVRDFSTDKRDDLLFVSATGSNRLALARTSERFELSDDRLEPRCREGLDSMQSAMSKASVIDVCGKVSSDWALICETIVDLLPLTTTATTILTVVLTPSEIGWEEDPANRCSVDRQSGLGDSARSERGCAHKESPARDRSEIKDRGVVHDRFCRDALRDLASDRGSILP